MPKKIPEFLNYFLQDCLQGNPEYSIKSMFSWFWIYKNWKIFAIYAMWELYFKVGENNLQDYKNYNSRIFKYKKKWKIATIWYYILPEEILEQREELDIWIWKSLEVKTKTKNNKKY